QKELNRLEVIQKIRDRRLTIVQATVLLDLSRSQIHRLLQAYDKFGQSGLISKRCGRPSNHRYDEDFRSAVLDIVRTYYQDFGPTLACEKLVERHQLSVSKETLRQWMTSAGL
ncbi:helix-turn-helix domain-containing protein, partial [Ochrobactrum sp. SFR4]|uniref:helix-turn-helix domain-containing protein n=1 Tax=Ochrobactrum sp. SFR4 TaxID=2717368 RepID=UPI001C8C4A36